MELDIERMDNGFTVKLRNKYFGDEALNKDLVITTAKELAEFMGKFSDEKVLKHLLNVKE